MPLFVSRPFFKTGFSCASALLLFAASAAAQTQSFSITEPLLSLNGGGQAFALANFNPTLGTLTDVTLTMKIEGKTITIFNTSNSSQDWVDLQLSAPGSAAKLNGADIANWGDSGGNLDVTYVKPAGKNVESMGIAGLLLYCTPKNGAANYISVNYTYDEGNNNNNGGGSPATPEPGVKYLSAIAAGAMVLMLIRRNLRRRGDAALPVL